MYPSDPWPAGKGKRPGGITAPGARRSGIGASPYVCQQGTDMCIGDTCGCYKWVCTTTGGCHWRLLGLPMLPRPGHSEPSRPAPSRLTKVSKGRRGTRGQGPGALGVRPPSVLWVKAISHGGKMATTYRAYLPGLSPSDGKILNIRVCVGGGICEDTAWLPTGGVAYFPYSLGTAQDLANGQTTLAYLRNDGVWVNVPIDPSAIQVAPNLLHPGSFATARKASLGVGYKSNRRGGRPRGVGGDGSCGPGIG